MTTATETWLWIGCAGMALGAIAIFALGSRLRAEDRHHAMVAFFITLVAACAYLALATGLATITVGGHSARIPRYADWLVTTPLLLLSLLAAWHSWRHLGRLVALAPSRRLAEVLRAAAPTTALAVAGVGALAPLGLAPAALVVTAALTVPHAAVVAGLDLAVSRRPSGRPRPRPAGAA